MLFGEWGGEGEVVSSVADTGATGTTGAMGERPVEGGHTEGDTAAKGSEMRSKEWSGEVMGVNRSVLVCVVVVGDIEMEEAVEEDSDQDRPFFFPMLDFDMVAMVHDHAVLRWVLGYWVAWVI